MALSLVTLIEESAAALEAADLVYGHGADNPFDEAAFLILEALNATLDDFDRVLNPAEIDVGRALIRRRIETRLPAAYLVNRAYIQGVPFYVDERVIIPRSFIGDVLMDEDGFIFCDYADRILDLCTGSGCLAVLAALVFPEAQIDAVDLSAEALAVAQRNVEDHSLSDRISLHQGDLFAPLAGRRYDLIMTNPPYVTPRSMAALPPEYRHEPDLALAGGDDDGMQIVSRILDQAADYLTPEGGLLCEIGAGRADLEARYPHLPFLWLETENSEGEVFWLTAEQLKQI